MFRHWTMTCEKNVLIERLFFLQELMAMREDKSDLRSQVFHLSRENQSLQLAIHSQRAQEGALKSKIACLEMDSTQEVLEKMRKNRYFDSASN